MLVGFIAIFREKGVRFVYSLSFVYESNPVVILWLRRAVRMIKFEFRFSTAAI